LIQELEDDKAALNETEHTHRELIMRLEKKFFDEKLNLQKEVNAKIGALATKAHKEAVNSLNDTTKDVYKENIRMSESLLYHVEESNELKRMNVLLAESNAQLLKENQDHEKIAKDKILGSKRNEIEAVFWFLI
jgi:hypothetical protein